MKYLPILFSVSIAANLVFAVLMLRRDAVTPKAPTRAEAIAPPSAGTSGAISAVRVPEVAPAPLEPDDFTGLATRLRSAGVPSHLARMALTAAIKQHFDHRRTQLGLRPDPAEFVRNPITNATSESREIEAARAALDREERELIRTLVGDDLQGSIDGMRRLAGNLPEDKAHRLLKIVGDYRQMEAQLYNENPDRGAPENRAKVALLEKEKRADIERLLTPDELLDYDLRTSATGGMLRNRLGMFTVTEAEFRALYAALKAVEDAADGAGVPRRRRERDAAFEPELRRVLGETRYAEMQAAGQRETERIRSFTEARTFTQGLKLPSTAANDLLIIQAEYRPRLAALAAARVATPEERETQIRALSAEAQVKLTRLLGESGFESYRQRMGRWVEPDASPNATTPPGPR